MLKRQAAEREKMFANYLPNKELVPRLYKELSKLTSKKGNNPIRIRAKDMKRHFLEEDTQQKKIPQKDVQH